MLKLLNEVLHCYMNLPTYTSGLLFTKAHKIVRARIYTVLEEYELSPIHWSILGTTSQAQEGIRLTNVAALIGVKAPMITTEANALITRGLIKRIPHHTDGRAKLLVATTAGNKMAGEVEARLNTEVGHLLHGLTKSDVAAFQKSLETIIHNANNKNLT